MSTDSVCEFLNNFVTGKDIKVGWDVISKLLACVPSSDKYPLLTSLSKLDEEGRIECIETLNKQPEFASRLHSFLHVRQESLPSILQQFNDSNYHLFALIVANKYWASIIEDSNFTAFKLTPNIHSCRAVSYPTKTNIYGDIVAMLAPLNGIADAILYGTIKADKKLLLKLSSYDWEIIRSGLPTSNVKEDILLQILSNRKCWEAFSFMMIPTLLEDIIKTCVASSVLTWYLPCRVSFVEIRKVCQEYKWDDSYYPPTEEAKQCFRALSYYHDNKDKDLLRYLLLRLTKVCYFDFKNAFGPSLYGTILNAYKEYADE